MRYLTVAEILEMYRLLMETSGGTFGIFSLNALESSVAQPHATFGGNELYPTLIDKASALGFSLVMNHPFVDGNKRIGHAAMEAFLIINGDEIFASVDDQESIILQLAAGKISREAFTDWLKEHIKSLE
jgi:death-on-curing protein